MAAGLEELSDLFAVENTLEDPRSIVLTGDQPALLFSDAAQTRHEVSSAPEDATFYVELPVLSEKDKEKYQSLEWSTTEEDIEDEDASNIIEIEGEYSFGGKHYLFARHGDNIVRRKEAWMFRTSYPDLYEDYTTRKESGELEPFDPSSTRIHPSHRINIVLNIKARSAKRMTRGRHVEDTSFAVSSELSEEELDVLSGDGSDSEDDFEVTGGSDDEDYGQPSRKAKRIKKKYGPKPAYGRIRNIEELYDSDPETASLREHRDKCERCHRAPAHILLKKTRRKNQKDKEDITEHGGESYKSLGGWVRCLRCCVAAHWSCLASTQRAEIAKAAFAKTETGNEESRSARGRFRDLEADEMTEFVCGPCSRGGNCMMCGQVVVEAACKPADLIPTNVTDNETETTPQNPISEAVENPSALEQARELLFRCFSCKRLAHYSHLPIGDRDLTISEAAEYYQKENGWQCSDCATYVFPLDRIIAWRPHPPNVSDSCETSQGAMNYKEDLPRQYLVKWTGRSFRRTEWVPHMWLVATHWAKLRNFYENGPKMTLLESPIEGAQHRSVNQGNVTEHAFFSVEAEEESRDASVEINSSINSPPAALPDAELRIPPSYKTIDRILDILVWVPQGRAYKISKKGGKHAKRRAESNDDRDDFLAEAQAQHDAALDNGEEPDDDYTETVEEYEKRIGRRLGKEDIEKVVWAFIKWDDLPYDEATWDSPPRPGSFGYVQFEYAYNYYLLSLSVEVKRKSASEIERFENRDGKTKWDSALLGVPESGRYDIGQDAQLRLLPFQVDGVNWLCRNWFHHQQCILADEMGLGKTVQVIVFLGILHARLKVFPALVVVPNSTITNWVREFAKWAPELRVVPFYGESKSREIIKKYELRHSNVGPRTTGAKYHVLVTTYEIVTGQKDFSSVFKRNPRWEVLIVDEGQRLKSDSNLIFRRLNELNSCHRIIMTGTPLNNNIRELFNLMNFLNAEDWHDLEALSEEFEDLDEDRVKDLHERLRPYFLRRVKADVLDLPPKNEVIVPLSMAPLQKEIYKSILSKNLDVLRSLTEVASTRINSSAVRKSNLRNMLMQLRKCLQHPYLIADDIEPKGLPPVEAHLKLIDASGKLRFLKMLLPKLKARGHRVLLFSQFVIALNIIEDFLQGEGYNFLRLDGDIKQAERQKSMDEFNRENSDVFIFILSTRAGGVGINLWSADTVIIFDPDFNPHQDLQAIARAHRYGQKKKCLVFKFMTKDSAEEKIIQAGKKKLVLDHLIVQKMDEEEDAGNFQSMLTFGAKALFVEEEGQGSRDIIYSENDVDKLIEKIEGGGDGTEPSEPTNNAFAFAKVWSAHRDDLDELSEEPEGADQADSWAQTLQKISAEQVRTKGQEMVGRGVRRKAALLKTKYFEDGSPEKISPKGKKGRKTHTSGSDDEYYLPPTRNVSETPTSGTSINYEDDGREEHTEKEMNIVKRQAKSSTSELERPLGRFLSLLNNNNGMELCGLCGNVHGLGECPMTDRSEHLAEYRKMLIISREESHEDRVEAIRAIDATLVQRGATHLIMGQPLKPFKENLIKDTTASLASVYSSSRPSGAMYGNGDGKSSQTTRMSDSHGKNDFPLPSFDIGSNKSKGSGSSLKRLPSPVAGRSPFHLPATCTEVARGPKSVAKAIARLSNEGGSQETLSALRIIFQKQKKELKWPVQPVASNSNSSQHELSRTIENSRP
ncbi:hypothetical protein M0805_000981 [Coniferiporia weirii]|nr:hypothetical protein M0805_000981 [Coniferiporia weirii]